MNSLNFYQNNMGKALAKTGTASAKVGWLLLATAMSTAVGSEENKPDGGVIGASVRRADEAALSIIRPNPARKTVIRAAVPKPVTAMTDLHLSIKGFRIEGIPNVSSDAIDKILQPWKDRELDFTAFELAVHAVAAYLRENGHPNAEVKLSKALIGGGTVAVAIQGLSVPNGALASVRAEDRSGEIVPKLEVKRFKLSGVTLATTEEMHGVLKPLEGKLLSMPEIEGAAELVANHLRAKGYPLVQAYLPPQKVDSGEIEITVQEGVVDGTQGFQGVKIVGGGERVKPEVLEQGLSQGVQPDQPLKIADLERAVLLGNDTLGIKSIKTTLLPGSKVGSTFVQAEVEETKQVTGTVWADNYGSRYTGTDRLNAQVNLNSPSGYGDQISINLSEAKDMHSSKLSYQAPVGRNGLKLGASVSAMTLNIGKEVTYLNLSSNTEITSIFANYPLQRSSSKNTWLTLSNDQKHVSNDLKSFNENDRRVALTNLGISGDLVDGLAGQIAWGMTYGLGKLDLGGNQTYQSRDSQTQRTEGDFSKLNWSLQRMAKINDDWSWMLSASGLVGSKNLDSSEKFQLGGPTGVRAYPIGEGLGDSGWLATAEVRYQLPQNNLGEPQLFAFYDAGRVKQYHSLWEGALTNRPNEFGLAGWGLGASITAAEKGSLRVMWAQKIGSNPNPTRTNTDSDGTNNSARIWIVGNILF